MALRSVATARKRKGMNVKAKPVCRIEGCGRPVLCAELCSPCYSGLYYWKDATPAKLVRRSNQLSVLTARLDVLLGQRRVHRLKRRAS